MKKFILTLFMLMLFAVPARAEIIGEVYGSDIGVLIDGQPAKAYNIDGSMYLIAEDLYDYGFNADWNESERTLDIYRNGRLAKTTLSINEINVKKSEFVVGEHLYDVYSSDIAVYVGGDRVDAKSVDGKMLIKVRELERYGTVEFDAERKLAIVEITRPCLEWDFEHVPKQELVIDENTTYIGEVIDGVPYGVGKLTTIERGHELRSAWLYAGATEFRAYEYRDVYGTADLKHEIFGYFKDGKPVEGIITTEDVVFDIKLHSKETRDIVLTNEYLEFYENDVAVYGSKKRDRPEELANYGGYTGKYVLHPTVFDTTGGSRYEYTCEPNKDYVFGIRISNLSIDGKETRFDK